MFGTWIEFYERRRGQDYGSALRAALACSNSRLVAGFRRHTPTKEG